jgi:branched-chain amino acid transport system ATP-binding protein
LFNLITGHLQPDMGRILFKGEDISHLPAHQVCRKGIARSFQIANIFPRLTVFRNVQVSVLSQKKLSRTMFRPAHRMVVEETRQILERVGLNDQQLALAGSLSHGDKRILEIAIALGNEPELLILDEPTAGMSPDETAATMALVQRLAREQGLTILFCEHDMDVVFNVATSIMVMQQGRTILQATPEEVRQNITVQEAYLGGA